MYNYQLSEMADKVIDALKQNFPTPELFSPLAWEKVQGALQAYWSDKVAITWDAEDIKTVAEESNITLTEDQVSEVLQKLLGRHDAEHGINWETIRSLVTEYKPT